MPEASIRRFALEGKIPSLKLKKGLRFNPAAVESALDRLADTNDLRDVEEVLRRRVRKVNHGGEEKKASEPGL